MHQDGIGDIARSDKLIISLGNEWLEKNSGNGEMMRLIARLLIVLRKVENTQLQMWDNLTPANFDNLIKATLMVSAADMDNEDVLRHP